MAQNNTLYNCAGKGCNNVATDYLKIDLIKKGGWFCLSCKKELEKIGLILS